MKLTPCKLALGALFALCASTATHASEITLKAVSGFGMDTFFSERFKVFVDKVNAEGKGIMQINVLGGPEAMPPFEVGNAVRTGVVDLASTTGVFHANLVPEALSLSFTNKSMSELRANGGYELVDRIHREKANIVWLGRVSDGLKYHVYTNKETDGTNFKGMKLRSVPVYRAFFQSLGATPLQVPPGEVYTALERGVVDGYGWPSIGVFDLGWQEKTKYRVEPGFYNVEVGLYMNQDTWKKLTDEQRAFLQKQIEWIESQNAQDLELEQQEKARQAKAGIQAVELAPEQAENFLAKAYESAWQGIDLASPKHAPELRRLLGNE
jgi:TRAP-type C4-dicarboxylate transport system substrate-binding protein